MASDEAPRTERPSGPAGGWGSLKAVAGVLHKTQVPIADVALLGRQNKPGGFACVSCAWAKPAHPHVAEFCENGAKATAWELTSHRAGPEFFDRHTLAELRQWSDQALEEQGRLTHPMRWDPTSDTYRAVGWEEALAEIGRELRAIDPARAVFYTSGRASLEASYLLQLYARAYGSNNLPDSSNMCHESTSVALPKTIGVPIGTVHLDDFEHTDAIFFFGQNVGTNSPRMLHKLQEARERGVPIVTFNPLREAGLVSFRNPQSTQMVTGAETGISTQYHTLRVGGDLAAIAGLCKALVDRHGPALDEAFIAEHTHGYADFAAALQRWRWSEIEQLSGLTQAALEEAAAVYAGARSVIAVYGMGLTQHRLGVQNVQMLTNLLLLGGHVGRRGAGICPVRGHSNVQGQRTVGITEKPELAPLDQLARQYGFEPPRKPGLTTVDTCQALLEGGLDAFIGLGGNFARAVPDSERLEPAWGRLRLTVQVATKLNRSHLVHGASAFLLPCLGRIEIDRQGGGAAQVVTVEDSTGHIHASHGAAEPAVRGLRSEIAIVAGLAEATLAPNPALRWRDWAGDYGLVRDAIATTYPEIFHDFNRRLDIPGGFAKPNSARDRIWKTDTGKANFATPDTLQADPDNPQGPDVLALTTLRSDDQFNTTIYAPDDRFRGIYGTRRVLLMNVRDIERLGLAHGDLVDACSAVDDGVVRRVRRLSVVRYDIPAGCVAGYFPECNPLVALQHHAVESKVPAFKNVPIRLERAGAA